MEKIDIYEFFEKNYFNQIKKVCFPATIRKSSWNYEVNPTVEPLFKFILKTVKSLDSNLDKSQFELLWMQFTGVMHSYFKNIGVNELYSPLIKNEYLIQKFLGKDVNLLKNKPEGLFIFYEREFALFLEKIKEKRKNWDNHLLE